MPKKQIKSDQTHKLQRIKNNVGGEMTQAPQPRQSRRQRIGAIVWLIWIAMAFTLVAFAIDCILFGIFNSIGNDSDHAFGMVLALNFVFGCVVTFSIFSENYPTNPS